MRVLFCSNDLVFPSQVSGMAREQSCDVTIVTTGEQLLQEVGQTQVTLVILDLKTPGVDPGHLVPRVREQSSQPISIVAFGPHVQSGRLAAARQAGCDEVLTQGQFHTRMAALLREHGKQA